MKKEVKLEEIKTKVKELKVKVKELKVDLQNPAFDPDLPEQKQRWFR